MAFDHPDPRLEGAISSRDQWNAHVAKWEGWAAEKHMCVQFYYWGSHEIMERLSRDEYRSAFAEADEQYARMLRALLSAVR